METLEQLIDEDLVPAFENLRFVTPDRLIRRYVAFAKRDFAAKIVPELQRRGLVSGEYSVPTRGCLQCLEEFYRTGAYPNGNCPSSGAQHHPQPLPGGDSCLIARIRRNIPTKESSGKTADQS